ncbi:MAG TPA: hypothetical protein VGH28_32945 [Polyangiaceae bacterium]|jgi:hypothetical protein
MRFELLFGAIALAIASPSIAAEPAAPVCNASWKSDVFEALDKCIDGDGDGCLVVGEDYVGACDSYASLKWYERGCALGSARSCHALTAFDR